MGVWQSTKMHLLRGLLIYKISYIYCYYCNSFMWGIIELLIYFDHFLNRRKYI
ncbi:hypothetical protein IKE_05767 [Bacillus cereus VD196]|uniref:Uncharacterized protein n=1 Tax=Bacillus cereus VD196 TaxID=1053243 RepID=A0A9W5PYK5_BACCE|nr:hypothetical protein IKE_05767 [Bacillus cereus VD196]